MSNQTKSGQDHEIVEQAQNALSQQTEQCNLIDKSNSKLKENVGLRFMLTSVAASSVANIAGYITGHPLDTIKVRQQTSSRQLTARQCAYATIVNEGTFSLYKGLS